MISLPNSKKLCEIVLPSGVFASIREPLAIDWLLAATEQYAEAALIARLVLFDGVPKPYSEVLSMPLDDYLAVLTHVGAIFKNIFKTSRGVS